MKLRWPLPHRISWSVQTHASQTDTQTTASGETYSPRVKRRVQKNYKMTGMGGHLFIRFSISKALQALTRKNTVLPMNERCRKMMKRLEKTFWATFLRNTKDGKMLIRGNNKLVFNFKRASGAYSGEYGRSYSTFSAKMTKSADCISSILLIWL